ncbi:MAG: chromate transporter [Mycoplasma sp.]|nr:chromate transporter [Mycoplasma sp.]
MEKTKSKTKEFFKVILFILKVTFIGYGGGNALMPIIRRFAVLKNKWLTDQEFDDVVIATNLIPGPSVVESLSYIAIKRLGKFWGIVATLIGILPHVIMAFLIFWLSNRFIPTKYLWIINTAIMPIIVSILILFVIRYIKISKKEIGVPIMLSLIILSFSFCFFVPTPYNIPAIIMIGVIIFVFLIEYIRSRKSGDK